MRISMKAVTRTLLVTTAGIGCVAGAAACSPSARVGLHTLGYADTGRQVPISASRSVAVAFTPGHDGQLSAIDVVASRAGAGSVGLLAYLVTANDPATGSPANPAAAPAGSEPECWGSVGDSALSAEPQPLTIYGSACPVQAGHKYWIQLSTVLSGADLYARQGNSVGHVLVQPARGAAWTQANVTGGLEVSPVTSTTAP